MGPIRLIKPTWPVAGLLALQLAAIPAGARADEVWAESVIDQGSALRDASAKVPAGAHVLGSQCSDVALPGLSYRYRCTVRFDPPGAAPSQPAASGKPGLTPPGTLP